MAWRPQLRGSGGPEANSMKIQVHERFASGLPEDDVHPYRSGAWRPQSTEYDAWDLDVEGEIPKDLAGAYLRNTENPLLPSIQRYHPFDGDGMLHSISFQAGEAVYHNRFVRTDGFRAEREAGESLWAGVAESPQVARREDGWGGAPSHEGRLEHRRGRPSMERALSSFWLCGDLYALRSRGP